MNNHDGLSSHTQLSVFLVNKPGVLSQICQRLADDKINIIGMTVQDSTEHGVLRLVCEEGKKAKSSLARLNLPLSETDVLLAVLPNRPGSLADVVERLAGHHINVNYAYCTTGSAGGKTYGVFKVSDMNRALQVLSERKPKRKQDTSSLRNAARVGRRS
ncbi:MAG: ACT domain-containing protein [Phycisphaerales bacterium]|nr:ACT domain-containing protein [Phycisphaerales bacterium]